MKIFFEPYPGLPLCVCPICGAVVGTWGLGYANTKSGFKASQNIHEEWHEARGGL